MKDYKIKVLNEDHAEAVQKRLFEIGCTWALNSTEVRHTDKDLYTISEMKIHFGMCVYVPFHEFKGKEITINDLYNDDIVNSIKGVTNTFEKGCWYKSKYTKTLVFIKDLSKDEFYGFDANGEWYVNKWYGYGSANPNDYTKATDDEVKERLLEEADRRGFNECGEYRFEGGRWKMGGDYRLFFHKNKLFPVYGTGVIYEDGVWGEIIKTPQLPTIHGYKGQDCGDYIKYGCAEFRKEWLLSKEFKSVYYLIVDDKYIREEDISKVIEYLESQRASGVILRDTMEYTNTCVNHSRLLGKI